MFRPSDDACLYPFLIPSNLFAVSVLRKIAEVHREARGDSAAAADAEALAAEVEAGLKRHELIPDGKGGQEWPYEIDGCGKDRKGVGWGKSVSVGVGLGGRLYINKKEQKK